MRVEASCFAHDFGGHRIHPDLPSLGPAVTDLAYAYESLLGAFLIVGTARLVLTTFRIIRWVHQSATPSTCP